MTIGTDDRLFDQVVDFVNDMNATGNHVEFAAYGSADHQFVI